LPRHRVADIVKAENPFSCLVLWLFVFALASHSTARADEPDEAKTEGGEPDSEASNADPFELPQGDAAALVEFIEGLRNRRPKGNSREEMIENFKKSNSAVLAAAEKLLSAKSEDKQRAVAVEAKLEALARLNQLGEASAHEQLLKFAEELKAGDDADLAKQAEAVLLQLRIRKLMMGETEGAEELVAEVTRQLAAEPDNMQTARLAMGVGQALEYSGNTDKLAVDAYRGFADILAKSSNPEIAQFATQLEGVIRRLRLMGNPIEIEGTLLDGTKFDQVSLKGKVVLVDFWATWCGPCIAELPNVLDNYKKYHDKGFEVIGISLDNSRDDLEGFLKENELPWPILFEDDSDDAKGWSNPMAAKYGISGIPTVILVEANGNVVSLNARGEKLGELLEKLLGPVE